MQCLLTEQKVYAGKVNGRFNAATLAAAQAWQRRTPCPVRPSFGRRNWMSLLVAGAAAGAEVRLDRAGRARTCSAP